MWSILMNVLAPLINPCFLEKSNFVSIPWDHLIWRITSMPGISKGKSSISKNGEDMLIFFFKFEGNSGGQLGFPGGSGKESPCQCRRHKLDPCVRKISWRRKWKLTPVFLPGKSHYQRSLECYSPWVCKEPAMT